jgi:hypothetical protein
VFFAITCSMFTHQPIHCFVVWGRWRQYAFMNERLIASGEHSCFLRAGLASVVEMRGFHSSLCHIEE